MAHWRRIVARLRSLLANKRAEEELTREITSHLTLLADDFERRDVHEEAQMAARRAYGGVEQANRRIATSALCCGSNNPCRTCAMGCAP